MEIFEFTDQREIEDVNLTPPLNSSAALPSMPPAPEHHENPSDLGPSD